MNDAIRAREVRLIGADGKQIGVVPLPEALRQSRVAGLDLVEVNATTDPPVCRLLDFGRFHYEQERQEREGKRKQKHADIKGIRITFKMSAHDQALRRAQTEKFLAAGHRVRVELPLRGREKALRLLGEQKLDDFLQTLAGVSTIEEPVSPAPRGFAALLAPKSS